MKKTWIEYLPWVMYSLNTRKHSTTEYRPDELYFGRPLNEFINSDKTQFNIDKQQCYIERAIELKETYDNKIPNFLEYTKKSQVWKKNAQDRRHKVDPNLIPIGTNVYIKMEGFKGKCDQRYCGPYEIVEHDEFDRYIVKDLLGESRISLNRERFKVVELDETKNATFI
jgi:3D (Asp-Asp-Asp) domain-containing protein